MLNFRNIYAAIIAGLLLSAVFPSTASENDLDEQAAETIKNLIGAAENEGILLLSFGGTGNMTTYTTPEMTSSSGIVTSEIAEIVPISFVITGPDTTVNASIGELSLHQSVPLTLSNSELPSVTAANLNNFTKETADRIRELASIPEKHPLLILGLSATGIAVYKSENEFNGSSPSAGELAKVLSGTAISSTTTSGATAEDDGCITYYYTIGGVTYVYVYCP